MVSKDASQTLNAEQVMAGLETEIVGQQVLFYPSVGSTNVIARMLAARKAHEGLVVLTDEQTAGQGRHGRRWVAPAGSSVLMSVIFRPNLRADEVSLLTMVVSLAAIDGIREITGLEATVKWPNDVLINRLKIGGILTETSLIGERLEHVVIGLGLNVNFDPADIPDIPPTASSLMVILGTPVDRLALVRAILTTLDRRYRALKAGRSSYEEWKRRLTTIGQRVRVAVPGATIEGTAEGVNQQGRLRIRRDDGTLVELAAGDVVTLRSREA